MAPIVSQPTQTLVVLQAAPIGVIASAHLSMELVTRTLALTLVVVHRVLIFLVLVPAKPTLNYESGKAALLRQLFFLAVFKT